MLADSGKALSASLVNFNGQSDRDASQHGVSHRDTTLFYCTPYKMIWLNAAPEGPAFCESIFGSQYKKMSMWSGSTFLPYVDPGFGTVSPFSALSLLSCADGFLQMLWSVSPHQPRHHRQPGTQCRPGQFAFH